MSLSTPELDGHSPFLGHVIPVNRDGIPMDEAGQGTPTHATKTAAAGTAGNLFSGPDAARRGARILNYLAAPIYLAKGDSGTPASGAPSDFVPSSVDGVPGQYEFHYRPVDQYRYVCAVAGGFTLITW